MITSLLKKNLILLFFISLATLSLATWAGAEDDEDEDDDDDRKSSSSSSSKPVVETSVKTSTQIIVIKDGDGDGLTDNQDPHPNIPEIYIVRDDNRNGIVDSFEQQTTSTSQTDVRP